MFDDEEEASGIYYSLAYETKVIRVLENLLIPSTIKIKMEISPDVDMHSLDMAKATLKIKAWVDSILNSSIIMSLDNSEIRAMLFDKDGTPRAINNIMLTPGPPTDDLLSVLLQAKFDALAGAEDTFTLCEVRSDNVLGLRSTFIGTARDYLPDNNEWIGDRSYFDQPWWNRDDVSTFDVMPPEHADLTKKPDWARPVSTPGFDFNMAPPQASSPEKSPSVIVRPTFKPRVIDGGKNDKPDA